MTKYDICAILYSMKPEIKILPIFNQSAPGVWEDFAHVYASTVRATYNHHVSDTDIADCIAKDRAAWRRNGLKFAFGAYDGADLIGFIQGDGNTRCVTVQSLYVLKEYQSMHVGMRLLNAAERALAPVAPKIELIALGGAMNFYKKHGYSSPLNTNAFSKKLIGGGVAGVVPVFKCLGGVSRVCGQISQSFDAASINTNHVPMFVFQNCAGRVLGYAVGSDNPMQPYDISELKVTGGFDPDWMRRDLQGAFSKLATHALSRAR